MRLILRQRQHPRWWLLTVSVLVVLTIGGIRLTRPLIATAQSARPAAAAAAQAEVRLTLEAFASGFTRPVDIAGTDDGRLFVVEKAGVIRVIDANGNVLPTPFLDLSGLNRIATAGNEQGLLGLIFQPGSAAIFYVNYTDISGDTVIARYRVTGANPNQANPDSEEIVLVIDQPYANHNAGDLLFGPDGNLYIPLGDGGSVGDPDENGQDLNELLGKILRINVTGVAAYTIPAGNPYANDGNANTRAEIWASGLRNPWRASFDRATGDLWIGDVGQRNWEEVNFQAATSAGGANYGWDCYEGNHPFEATDCAAVGQYTFPIFEYPHSQGCSITGGFVYRGTQFQDLVGRYIFADFCSGNFWSLGANGQAGWVATLHGAEEISPSTFGEAADGELYVADYVGGGIYHVRSGSAADATITIVKDAQPNSKTNFRFSGDLGAFRLDDITPDDRDQYPKQATFTVAPGLYTVAESVPNNMQLNITCTPTANGTVDLAQSRVAIRVAAAEQVSCTFTNQLNATIRARKYDDRNQNGQRNPQEAYLAGWTIQLYNALGNLVNSQVTNKAGKVSFANLRPGDYAICEVLRAGWHNIAPPGLHPTYSKPCYTRTIMPGETVEFLFGNSTTPTASAVSQPEISGNLLVTPADTNETAIETGDEAGDIVVTDDAWLNAAEPEELIHTIFLPVIGR